MKNVKRLASRIVAYATAAAVAAVGTVVIAQPAQAYCQISRWRFTIYTMHVRSSIPSTWNTAVSGAMNQWNGISGSTLRLAGPQFNSNVANPEFLFYRTNFATAGLPDVPGITLGPANSGTHSTAEVILNTRFTWNTSGTMNQAQRRTDVRTVSVHEIGHANGLHHPSVCGAMTAAEVASVMNVTWTNKPNTNSDDKAGIAAHY